MLYYVLSELFMIFRSNAATTMRKFCLFTGDIRCLMFGSFQKLECMLQLNKMISKIYFLVQEIPAAFNT